MEYTDVIRQNCLEHSRVPWWPKFAFHYTDVTNAVSILSSGFLYSRFKAKNMHLMQNDNASRQVIDMTNSQVMSQVRFYFRPLTPTQYYNEGYKHPALRYEGDENANVPVPVFFLFDLEKLLALPGVQFSETSQAGHGAALYSGVEAFSKLNFDSIYDNTFENLEATKAYRHAEIVHPDSLAISSCIKTILCRNSLERTTLLNLLRDENPLAATKYKSIIKVPKQDVFENNGLFLTDCVYFSNMVTIMFSDAYNGREYIRRMMNRYKLTKLKPIRMIVNLEWVNSRKIIYQETVESHVNVREPGGIITITGIRSFSQAKKIRIKVFFEDKLMCYVKQSLEPSEII